MRNFFFQVWWFPILFLLFFAVLTLVFIESMNGFVACFVLTFSCWIWTNVASIYQFTQQKIWQGVLLQLVFLSPLILFTIGISLAFSFGVELGIEFMSKFFSALGGR